MLKLGNAAGVVKYPQDLNPLLKIPSDILSAITLGSYTPEERQGNSGNTYWDNDFNAPTSLNSLGLPNPGIKKAVEFLHKSCEEISKSNKSPRVSIAGFTVTDYRDMVKKLLGHGLSEIELNLGCPNIRDHGEQKPIFAFQPKLIAEILETVYKVSDHLGAPSIALKLSPYSDPYLLREVAKVIAERRNMVQTVVTSNTYPNGYGFKRDGLPLIDANDGYAGIGGEALKHIALGQVRQFRQLLPREIAIIGVGGVSNGKDVKDLEHAGASFVQVGTSFFKYGPKVFGEIQAGLGEVA